MSFGKPLPPSQKTSDPHSATVPLLCLLLPGCVPHLCARLVHRPRSQVSCLLRTFISRCLLDVSWVPQTHTMSELTYFSSSPNASHHVLPVPRNPSQCPPFPAAHGKDLDITRMPVPSLSYLKFTTNPKDSANPPLLSVPQHPCPGPIHHHPYWDHSSLVTTGLPAPNPVPLICGNLRSQKGL